MIETEVFRELNIFGPNGGPTPDLLGDAPPAETESDPKCCGFFRRRPRSRVSLKVVLIVSCTEPLILFLYLILVEYIRCIGELKVAGYFNATLNFY